MPPTSFAVGPSTETFWKMQRNLRVPLDDIGSSCAPLLPERFWSEKTDATVPVVLGGSASQTQSAIEGEP